MYAVVCRIADELFLLNGGSGSAKPAEAHDDAAAAETAAAAVPGVLCRTAFLSVCSSKI
jgi:hypothetical protein